MARHLVRIVCSLMLAAVAPGIATAAHAQSSGPFLTLLFSRTAITAAQHCAEQTAGVARLDTVVAPALRNLGLHITGSLETGSMSDGTMWCGHDNSTLYASWQQAQSLASNFGWSFISHTSTYPTSAGAWAAMSAQQRFDETCGSAQAISAHGLLGANGSMAWPDGYIFPPARSLVEQCFDFSRGYGASGVTSESQATVAPYSEPVEGFSGGACNDPTAACYSAASPLTTLRYASPAALLSQIDALTSSQWLTLQAYVLVTGAMPGQWDCTSPNWEDHWTSDDERYCWNDYLSVVCHLPSSVTVTDPAAVGAAWGRTVPATPSVASLTVTPSNRLALTGEPLSVTAGAIDAIGDSLGDVTSAAAWSISPDGTCQAGLCTPAHPGPHEITASLGSVSATTTIDATSMPVASLGLSVYPLRVTTGRPVDVHVHGLALGLAPLGPITNVADVTLDGHPCPGGICVPLQGSAGLIQASVDGLVADSTITVSPPGNTLGPLNVSPATATVGETLTVQGTDLTSVIGGSLGGVPVTINPVDARDVSITVPPGTLDRSLALTTPASTTYVPVAWALKPSVTGIDHSWVIAGDTVLVHGTGLGQVTAANIGGIPAPILSTTDGQVAVTVPTAASTGPLTLTSPAGVTTAGDLTVVPQIQTVSPNFASAGQTLTVVGTGLADVTSLRFSPGVNVPAHPSADGTTVTAVVPSSALTGLVHAVTANAQAASPSAVLVKLSVTSLAPTNVMIGDQLTLSGSGLPWGSTVVFNGGAESPASWISGSTLTTTVPPGAMSGPVEVVGPAGGRAQAPGVLTVTG